DAVALINAAKLGDAKALEDAKAKLYANADAIASFLVSVNSNLQLGELKSMMRQDIDLLVAEVVDHMNANYPADIADYDASVAHLLNFADALSSAIAKSFPQ